MAPLTLSEERPGSLEKASFKRLSKKPICRFVVDVRDDRGEGRCVEKPYVGDEMHCRRKIIKMIDSFCILCLSWSSHS